MEEVEATVEEDTAEEEEATASSRAVVRPHLSLPLFSARADLDFLAFLCLRSLDGFVLLSLRRRRMCVLIPVAPRLGLA